MKEPVVGLIARVDSEKALALRDELASWCKGQKYKVELLDGAVRDGRSVRAFVDRCNIVVSLGGDGTLLGIARHIGASNPVFIGVHLGQLGFLTEILSDEVPATIKAVLSGTALIRDRALLEVRILRKAKVLFSGQAVNDVVVQKGSRDRLVSYDISIDEEPSLTLRADGLILASPTGSTAYSLAAGGSIVDPALGAMLLTPICPHALTFRPLILGSDRKVSVIVPEFEGRMSASLDGQEHFDLMPDDVVCVNRSPNVLRSVGSPHRGYFGTLRAKLNWGIANKGT